MTNDSTLIYREKVKLDSWYTTCTKIISKWIIDEHVKDETTKLPENIIR